MKTCPSCRVDKDASKFGKNKRQKDGLAFYCRECARKKALDEIAKCELTCANCHRERTVACLIKVA